MPLKAIRRNFSGGEVADTLIARDDLAKAQTACREMKNFIPQLHGGARFRTGFQAVWEAAGGGRLFPFAFSTEPEDTYLLVFMEKKIQFVQNGGAIVLPDDVVYEIDSPYSLADLRGLKFAQCGDIIGFAHKEYGIHMLYRHDHTDWAIEPCTFGIDLQPPPKDSVTLTWSGESDEYTIRYKITSVNEDGEESVGSEELVVPFAKAGGDWVYQDKVTMTWADVEGADTYNIYKSEGGVYGYIGTSHDGTFRDDNYKPDTSVTPQVHNDPFKEGNNPLFLAFHQQRLWVAGASKNPTTIYASRVGDFTNFNKCRPLQEDDSLEFTLASGSLNRIQWATPFGDLMLGTTGAEFRVQGSAKGTAVTTTEYGLKAESYWGSSNLDPIVIGNSIIHVTRLRSRVRDLFWSLEKDGYAGNDLSLLASHLFDGYTLIAWAYQQEPDSILFAVRDDGLMIGLTYMKEHEIWGWFRVETDGKFLDVCSVSNADNAEDDIYVIVEREVSGITRHFVERLAPKWRSRDGLENANYLDCSATYKGEPTTVISGLDYIENAAVTAFADGNVVEGMTVVGGKIILPDAASVVHVGFPYEGVLEPMPIETDLKDGTTHGQVRALGQVHLRLHDSMGGKVGATGGFLDEIRYEHDPLNENQPFTGIIKQAVDNGTAEEVSVRVVQDKPRPMTVTAIVQEIDL